MLPGAQLANRDTNGSLLATNLVNAPLLKRKQKLLIVDY